MDTELQKIPTWVKDKSKQKGFKSIAEYISFMDAGNERFNEILASQSELIKQVFDAQAEHRDHILTYQHQFFQQVLDAQGVARTEIRQAAAEVWELKEQNKKLIDSLRNLYTYFIETDVANKLAQLLEGQRDLRQRVTTWNVNLVESHERIMQEFNPED